MRITLAVLVALVGFVAIGSIPNDTVVGVLGLIWLILAPVGYFAWKRAGFPGIHRERRGLQPANARTSVIEEPAAQHISQLVEVYDAPTSSPSISPAVSPSPGRRSATAKQPAHPTLVQMVQSMNFEPLRPDRDEQIEVAGETYRTKSFRKLFRDHGMPITTKGTTLDTEIALVPEPWNPHDPNAVAVMAGPHHVGYIPADQAADYAEPLGRLAARSTLVTGTARIWVKEDGGGILRARVTILVPEADTI